MKNCPFCKAEIEDNAAFCLYCMTDLEEKQEVKTGSEKATKKITSLIIAITIFLLLGVGVLVFALCSKNSSPQHHSTSSADEAIVQTSASENFTDSKNPLSANGIPHISGEAKQDTTESATKPVNKETTPQSDTSNTIVPAQDSTNPKTTQPVQTAPTYSGVTYSYRQATHGDDFYVHYPISDNDIVLTGVLTPSADGRYIIPSTIDGKNVLAISALAFSDPDICNTVELVVVPACVKTVWNNAFANCKNLTDIYLCGNSIYIETNAFASPSQRNGTLTIHCSANCQDRTYRYYKNSAEYYGAQYKEWNGGEYN